MKWTLRQHVLCDAAALIAFASLMSHAVQGQTVTSPRAGNAQYSPANGQAYRAPYYYYYYPAQTYGQGALGYYYYPGAASVATTRRYYYPAGGALYVRSNSSGYSSAYVVPGAAAASVPGATNASSSEPAGSAPISQGRHLPFLRGAPVHRDVPVQGFPRRNDYHYKS